MDGPEGKQIESAEEMIGRFLGELNSQIPHWKQSLDQSPSQLEQIERAVHQSFARGADMLVAGLLAITMVSDQLQRAEQQTRKNYSRPLAKGRERTIAVRLLGGMFLWVTTLYCPPKKKRFGRDDKPRVGIDLTLAQFGFGKAVSPALQSQVARKVALCPSISFAHQELLRDGVQLDAKTVKRVTYQCGEGLLALRTHRIEQMRQGKLPVGDELAGKRVSVQIDGGRMKIRGPMRKKLKTSEKVDDDGLLIEDSPGRSRKVPKRTYQTDWREPKLVTIFIHDEYGKMEKKTKATIDGTLRGPDAIAEVIAMHLHRLGAAKALSVTFVADGAPWIWDRVSWIIKMAGLQNVETVEVLDCCHAVHHISLALAALGLSKEERNPLYRQHRTLLRNGQWRRVVEELSSLQREDDPIDALNTETSYLRHHGEAGRLSYVSFRSRGLPCGSGAIESGIRRVINLRLKSNAMFWTAENAESMLQVRSQVIPDQWDKAMVELAEFRRTVAYDGYQWTPVETSCKSENSHSTAT
ncbi:hypothetical protein [Stieleria varia]|nr:hypothetical protein [Stieleria varia]